MIQRLENKRKKKTELKCISKFIVSFMMELNEIEENRNCSYYLTKMDKSYLKAPAYRHVCEIDHFDSPECFTGSKYFMPSPFVNASSQIQLWSKIQQVDILEVRRI